MNKRAKPNRKFPVLLRELKPGDPAHAMGYTHVIEQADFLWTGDCHPMRGLAEANRFMVLHGMSPVDEATMNLLRGDF